MDISRVYRVKISNVLNTLPDRASAYSFVSVCEWECVTIVATGIFDLLGFTQCFESVMKYACSRCWKWLLWALWSHCELLFNSQDWICHQSSSSCLAEDGQHQIHLVGDVCSLGVVSAQSGLNFSYGVGLYCTCGFLVFLQYAKSLSCSLLLSNEAW